MKEEKKRMNAMSKKRNAARERKKPLNNSLRIVRKTTS